MERENDRELALDRAREEALQRYLDRMQELILDRGLRTSGKDAEIREVSRARTLAVLRTLDGTRKGSVLRFLRDSDLLGRNELNQDSMDDQRLEAITDIECTDLTDVVLSLGDRYELHGPKFANRQIVEAVIDLEYADLSEINLSYAKFMGIDLSGTNLTEANLYEADLSGADLSRANLSGANLVYADLTDANLEVANLDEIFLEGALLIDANLNATTMRGAYLRDADLRGAMLSQVVLSHADLSGTNLRGTKELSGHTLATADVLSYTTLPDGTKIETEEEEAAFKQQYTQRDE